MTETTDTFKIIKTVCDPASDKTVQIIEKLPHSRFVAKTIARRLLVDSEKYTYYNGVQYVQPANKQQTVLPSKISWGEHFRECLHVIKTVCGIR